MQGKSGKGVVAVVGAWSGRAGTVHRIQGLLTVLTEVKVLARSVLPHGEARDAVIAALVETQLWAGKAMDAIPLGGPDDL